MNEQNDMMYCTYYENDQNVEHDLVKNENIVLWFKDSFQHHTGTEPTKEMCDDFILNKKLIVQDGNLEMKWNNDNIIP